MIEVAANRAKTYAYLLDDDNEIKKAKGVKRCVIERRLMFESYRDSLFNNEIIMRTQMRFKSDHHMYTEEIRIRHIHMVQMLLKYVKVKC